MRKRYATTSPGRNTERPRSAVPGVALGPLDPLVRLLVVAQVASGLVVVPDVRCRRRTGLVRSPEQALDAQMCADSGEDLVALKRLRDEVDSAGLEPAHFVFGIVERGKEDHRGVARLGGVLEAAACFVAVDPGHDDIEQDHPGVRALSHFERFLPSACEQQAVTLAVERPAQDVQVRRVVVNQKDPVGLVGWRRWRLMVHGFLGEHAATRGRSVYAGAPTDASTPALAGRPDVLGDRKSITLSALSSPRRSALLNIDEACRKASGSSDGNRPTWRER